MSTDQVQIENAELFQRILDDFPDIVQSVDAKGRIVYVNRRATELLGYTRDELLCMNITQLYAPELMPLVMHGFSVLQKRGSLSVCESTILDKEGNRITVEIRSFAVYDDHGGFLHTLSILRDIRSLKELQDKLVHASRLASIGEFAASIAHDVLNPLSTIRLAGFLLHAELEEHLPDSEHAESLRNTLDTVDMAVGKMEKLITQLRDLARSNETNPQAFDLRRVVDDALMMTQDKMRQTDVTLNVDLPSTPCVTVGHDTQLEQVLMNLIANACDSMEETDGPRLMIRLQPAEDSVGTQYWELVVGDNGCGIAPAVIPKIFDTFFTTKKKGKGSGLGLAIAQSVVKTHGGSISVRSHPGMGTSFTIALPNAVGLAAKGNHEYGDVSDDG